MLALKTLFAIVAILVVAGVLGWILFERALRRNARNYVHGTGMRTGIEDIPARVPLNSNQPPDANPLPPREYQGTWTPK